MFSCLDWSYGFGGRRPQKSHYHHIKHSCYHVHAVTDEVNMITQLRQCLPGFSTVKTLAPPFLNHALLVCPLFES